MGTSTFLRWQACICALDADRASGHAHHLEPSNTASGSQSTTGLLSGEPETHRGATSREQGQPLCPALKQAAGDSCISQAIATMASGNSPWRQAPAGARKIRGTPCWPRERVHQAARIRQPFSADHPGCCLAGTCSPGYQERRNFVSQDLFSYCWPSFWISSVRTRDHLRASSWASIEPSLTEQDPASHVPIFTLQGTGQLQNACSVVCINLFLDM